MKKINYNKAQVSAEFILIFTVVLSSFLLFLNIINSRLGEVQEQKEYILMQTLASNIKEEIILATQVHNNYIRRFSIPLNINTKDYNMYIEKNELKIDLYDAGNYEGEPSKTVYAVLPIDVKGGFVEEKDENTLDHCVTKNQFDGIRISRNQVSLDIDTRNFEVNEF
ncbi:class III signal peptide-containing protein, partial [archaeon]|nr:class III signal peptide-containing protein [archaeon]